MIEMGVRGDATECAIRYLQQDSIKDQVPKVLSCPLRVEVVGILALAQVPLVNKLITSVDEQIEDEMYNATKFYISSSRDVLSLEDAVSFYTGEKYRDNVERLYEERLSAIENGEA